MPTRSSSASCTSKGCRTCSASVRCASARRFPRSCSFALDLERDAILRLNAGIATCIAAGDHGSRELLDHILEGEEEHADWIETQLELLRQLGESHYLAQQIRG